jgi:hypothetical protein
MKRRIVLNPFMREEGDPMTSIPQVAEAIGRILTVEADQLAREVGFIQRERVRSRGRFCANLAAGLAAGARDGL